MDVGARCGGHRRRLGPRCRLILATVSSLPSRAVRRPSRSRQIVLTLTVGLVLGLTLAAVDAGRRADTSVDRFIDFSRPADLVVFSFAFEPPVSALVEQTAQLA